MQLANLVNTPSKSIMDFTEINDIMKKLDKTFWKSGRLETFVNWPFSDEHKCNAKSMAEAGFYSKQEENEIDLVQCFICQKQLDGWEEEDDPWSEHEKHQKDCPFILLGKKNELDYTVTDFINLVKLYCSAQIATKYANKKAEAVKLHQCLKEQLPHVLRLQKNSKS